MEKPEEPHAEVLDKGTLQADEALSARLAALWWAFFVRGLIAAAIGIAALFWPTASMSLLLQLMGLLLVLDGGFTLLGFGRRGAAGGVGIGSILIGLILLVWPEGTARFAFLLLGTFALISGVGALLTWRRIPEWEPERMTARNAGILALLIGLILFFWPGSGVVALGWAIALTALVVAIIMFWLAARFRRLHTHRRTRIINAR